MHDARKRRTTGALVLALVILFLAAIIVSAQPGAILAQARPTPSLTTTPRSYTSTATYTPTITYTASPYTPTITPTPSNTPTTIPTLAAILSDRKVIRAANADQLGKLRAWQVMAGPVTGVAFLPNTTRLLTVGYEAVDKPQPLHIWDIGGNQVVEVDNYFEDSQRLVGSGSYNVLSLSPDGTRVVLTGYGTAVWDTHTGRLMGRAMQSGSARGVLDASNQMLLVGGNWRWRMVGIWLIQPVIPSEGPDAPPLPDNYVFDTQGILDRTIEIGEDVDQLAIDSTTGHIFVLTLSGRLLIYKRVTDIDYDLTVAPQAPIRAEHSIWGVKGGHKMILDETRHQITYNDKNRDLIVYDYVNNKVVDQYPLVDPIACLNYSANGRLLLISDWGWDMSLKLVDTATHETLASVITGQVIASCTLSWDERLIATGDVEGNVVLWGVPATK